MTSYNPSICLLPRCSLQKRIIGSNSSFDRGMPSPFILTSSTLVKPFLNAVTASGANADSAGGGRWKIKKGVGHGLGSVGYERRGPETLTMDPNARGMYSFASVADVESDGGKDFWACDNWLRQYSRANSAAKLPPCAKRKK